MPACSARACSGRRQLAARRAAGRSRRRARRPAQPLDPLDLRDREEQRGPVRVTGLTSAGSGTGFVIDSGGVIVTNAHVVKDAQKVEVRLDDRSGYVDADLVGTDLSSDIAVLRVDSAAASKLRPLPLADSDKVRVGDQTLAIGYPLGINRSASASAGIVSGLGRSIDAQNQFSIDKVIQTDAAINPGNSGGPLLDSPGVVIGVIPRSSPPAAAGSVGVGFAVPSNTMRQVVPAARARPHDRARVPRREDGREPDRDRRARRGGHPGAPAESGGVRPGDLIVKVAGQTVTASDDVSLAILNRKPGQRVQVEVQRRGTRQTLRVTLGTRPEGASTASSGTP